MPELPNVPQNPQQALDELQKRRLDLESELTTQLSELGGKLDDVRNFMAQGRGQLKAAQEFLIETKEQVRERLLEDIEGQILSDGTELLDNYLSDALEGKLEALGNQVDEILEKALEKIEEKLEAELISAENGLGQLADVNQQGVEVLSKLTEVFEDVLDEVEIQLNEAIALVMETTDNLKQGIIAYCRQPLTAMRDELLGMLEELLLNYIREKEATKQQIQEQFRQAIHPMIDTMVSHLGGAIDSLTQQIVSSVAGSDESSAAARDVIQEFEALKDQMMDAYDSFRDVASDVGLSI